jgi:hypothetical protein
LSGIREATKRKRLINHIFPKAAPCVILNLH